MGQQTSFCLMQYLESEVIKYYDAMIVEMTQMERKGGGLES